MIAPRTRPPARAFVAALLVAALVMAPPVRAQTADPDPWFGKDKALHFGFSVGIASFAYLVSATELEPRYQALLLAGGATVAIGAGKELIDMTGAGDPSWRDFTWDVIGAVVGLGLSWGLDLLIRGVSDAHPAFGAPHPAPSARAVAPGTLLVF